MKPYPPARARLSVAILAVVVGLLATASSEASAEVAEKSTHASGPITYIIKSRPLAPGVGGAVGAPCPSGSRLAGGGGGIAIDRLTQGHISELEPLAYNADDIPDDAYNAGFYNASSKQRTITSATICISRYEEWLEYREDVDEGPGRTVSIVPCEREYREILGGGFGSNVSFADATLFGFAPRSTKTQWLFSYQIDGTTGSAFRWMICAFNTIYDLEYVAASHDSDSNASETRSLRAKCDPGERVVGGGVYPSFGGGTVLSSLPFDDGDSNSAPEDGWRGRFETIGADATVTVRAICMNI